MSLRHYFRLLAEDRIHRSFARWFWNPVLSLAAVFYRMGLNLHRLSYQAGVFKRRDLQVPVIGVGNLTWGGTGKTPMVEYVARFFINRKQVPLVLARGYGQDESKMLTRQLPEAKLGFGPDRYAIGKKLLASGGVDIVILDDGFQHWRIKKDVEIVVINALNPFGNGFLIPRGILREPLAGLKRASVVILSDVNLMPRKDLDQLKSQIQTFAPQVRFVEAHREALYFYRPGSRDRIHVHKLQGNRVTAFSGIGTPQSFRMMLNQIGVKTVRSFEFPDHHQFRDHELREIVQVKEISESKEIVTTEKDYFRCEERIREMVKPLVLKVRLRLMTGETILHQFLGRMTSSRDRSAHLQEVSDATHEHHSNETNAQEVCETPSGNGMAEGDRKPDGG